MLPLAPVLFSTTTCCDQISARRAPTMRDVASIPPPAASGQMIRTTRAGQSRACARGGQAVAAPSRARKSRRLMMSPGSRAAARPPSALERRIVAREYRLLQKPLGIVGPELAGPLVGLDCPGPQRAVLLLDPPDLHVERRVAVVVETQRSARCVGERHRPHGLHQELRVVGLAAGLLERRLDDLPVDVEAGRIGADRDILAVVLPH